MDTVEPKATVDARGLACPLPLLKAKQHMEKLGQGDVLEILGTDSGSKIDLPAWSKHAGHVFLGSEEDSNGFRFYIKKG